MSLLLILPLIIISSTVFSQTTLIDSLLKVVTLEIKDEQTLKAYQALVNEYRRTNLEKYRRMRMKVKLSQNSGRCGSC